MTAPCSPKASRWGYIGPNVEKGRGRKKRTEDVVFSVGRGAGEYLQCFRGKHDMRVSNPDPRRNEGLIVEYSHVFQVNELEVGKARDRKCKSVC